MKNKDLINLGIETRDLLYYNFDSLPEDIKPLLNKWRKTLINLELS